MKRILNALNIKHIYKEYAIIETELGIGICYTSDFSDYKINNLWRFIALYQPKRFILTGQITLNKEKFLKLSYKELNPIFCFPPHKLMHTFSGFKKLKQYVYRLIYNDIKQQKKDATKTNSY